MKKIALPLLIFILVIPIVYIILLSVFSFYKYPQLFPTKFTLSYWTGILSDNSLLYRSIYSSIMIGFLTAVFSTIVGIMTARAIVHHFKTDNKYVNLLISVPLFIPGISLFLGIHQVLLKTPFANHISGIVLAHMVICIPYTTNIAIAYFRGIPIEIEYVSKTLGSSRINTFTKVLLPILRPGIALSMAICFLISNTEYFSTFLIGGGNVISLSMLMYPFVANSDYGYSSVTGIIFIAINLSVFLIADWIVRKNNIKNTLYSEG